MANTTKIISGKDGELLATTKAGVNLPLAEVDAFTAQVSVTNKDFQPIGSALISAICTGYSVTLTLTEAVVRDNIMITEFIEEMKNGYVPSFEFQGKLHRRITSGNPEQEYERVIFRDCVPDGKTDLLNIAQGEVIKRVWNFRVNEPPEMQDFFPG